jgi:hypothetical protein
MVSRRDVLSAGVLAGTVGATLGVPRDASPGPAQDDATRVVGALNRIAEELQKQRQVEQINQSVFGPRIRSAMNAYFRSRSHFPVFFDVGIDVWSDIYDWHVATHQPIVVSRIQGNYYTMTFTHTTLVLRPDVEPDYISAPYDER